MWNLQVADLKMAEMDTMDMKTNHSYTTRTTAESKFAAAF